MNEFEKEDSLTLGVLNAIEEKEDLTQRVLASQLGVALGLTNSCLKRCARKGFVKIKQAPANRYLYYLTPKGFSEKSRLSAKYLSISFGFYRKASASFTKIYRECALTKKVRILLCGVSELSEIAFIRAQEFDVHIIGIWDSISRSENHLGLAQWSRLEEAGNYEVAIITSLVRAEDDYKELKKSNVCQRIFVPEILGYTPEYLDGS